ncbi:MBL fold metallo-hydrolase [Roseobacter ponti]|uniref:MBL fold metallo-hydrolase n=1 Tax=Roseobacter ponti TaxID=1891787 RepID=A0A858ST12_9RHOB|nr:MBL fold metallo-hydrolase [Roseobacter ponti]QJF51815.1 MBL fold metallo-hydrolase [Roseobacter ponti]
MTLPVDADWYRHEELDARTVLITEPRVHPIFSANMHLVLGRDKDLLIDSGMGVAPLKPFVDAQRPDPGKPLILLSTHTHVDHIGAAHEFATRLVHPLEAAEMEAPSEYSLRSDAIPDRFRALFEEAGYEALWPLLIDAVPHEGYDPDGWRLQGAVPTGTVEEGDVIDLGDWQAEVLHLPGHSPGQVGLFHHDSGTLFGADAIYDGPLIYDGPGMSIPDYAATLRRIAALPVIRVHGGHDPAFGKARLDEIVTEYLQRWGA